METGISWFKKGGLGGGGLGDLLYLCLNNSLTTILDFDSGLTGLYRGISSNITTSAPISAIYAFTYESVKGYLLPSLSKVTANSFSFVTCSICLLIWL